VNHALSWPGNCALALAALCTLAAQTAHAVLEEARDGILFIQVVGYMPVPDDDDFPDQQGEDPNTGDKLNIYNDDFGAQGDCFDTYENPTLNFELVLTDTTWGSANSSFGDVDRVEIGARPASEFGFNRDALLYDGGTPNDPSDDLTCAEVEPQWKAYEEPGFGQLLVLGSTLRIEAGTAGTEVRLEDGFELAFLGGSRLEVEGTADDPVVFRGTQWPGLSIGAGVVADLDQCTFRDARGGGALRIADGATLRINDCEFRNNEGRFGGAISAEGATADIRIEDTVFRDNEATRGGAVYLAGTDGAVLRNLTFEGNEALSNGGGLYLFNTSATRLENVTLIDNLAGRGGGIAVLAGDVVLWNPLIAGNTGRTEGGGMSLQFLPAPFPPASATLYNPTVAFNESSRGGGIDVVGGGSTLDVRNAIIWGNVLRENGAGGSQLGDFSDATVNLRQVLLDGGLAGYGGPALPDIAGLVAGTPGFRQAPNEAGEGGGVAQADLRMASDSEAINAGDDALYQGGPLGPGGQPVDRDGGARIFAGEAPAIDLGAFEFPNNPPTLFSTAPIDRSVSEGDAPIRLDLCASYADADVQPDFPNTVQAPWLTLAPGEDPNLPREPGQRSGLGFGDVLAYTAGGPGDPVAGGQAIGDAAGRAFYDPANRSADYSVVFECRVRDQLIDAAGEESDVLSMFSRAAQRVTVTVSARNQPPTLLAPPSTEARVDRDYDSELRFDDPDVDHEARDLDLGIVEGPSWLSLRRTDEATAVLAGRPPAAGAVDVALQLVDPDGGTELRRFTITVEAPEPLDPVEAGDDRTAEPGDRVLLSATGPDQPGLAYEWRIEDDAGNEVDRQLGRDYNWTARAGIFTATIELRDGADLVDEDSLTISVEPGADGTLLDPEDRSAPTQGQRAELDGMSAGGSPANQSAWDALGEADQAAALADLAETDLTEAQQDLVLDELAALLASAPAPIDAAVLADLGAAYAKLAALPLTPARRAEVLDGLDALRARAADDGAASDALFASLVEAASGLAAGGNLGADERSRLLDGLAGDLAEAVQAGRTLTGAALTLAFTGICNAFAGAELSTAQIDLVIGALDDAIALAVTPTRAQLARAVLCGADLLARTTGGALTDVQRAAVIDYAVRVADTAIAEDQAISVVGSAYLKVAATAVPAGAAGDVTLGDATGGGPTLRVSAAALAELRQRNAVPGGAAIGLALIGSLRSPELSLAVRIRATDDAGQPLGETRLQEPVRVTIPRTVEGDLEPISTGTTPVTTSNVSSDAQSVSFDTDGFSSFTLSARIEPGPERSDADKASCFLDSLF
jgi:hypothetical protein